MYFVVRIFIICIFFILFALPALADKQERSIEEAQSILEQIKEKNKLGNGYASVSMGIIQLSTPYTADPLLLNASSLMPFMAVEVDSRIADEWGMFGKFTHAQNVLFPVNNDAASGIVSSNSSGSYQEMIEFGGRYKFLLDQTNIKSYVLVKAGYYIMQNNFQLSQANGQQPSNYLKSIQGILLGIERSIPATPQFDFKGGLDLIWVNQIQNLNPAFFTNQSGTGFQFRGEVFYNFEWLNTIVRLGGAYTMGVFFNQFGGETPIAYQHNAHVQAYRELSVLLNFQY